MNLLDTALPATGNTRETGPENRAFYPALDGLRALAFVLVFLSHYLRLPWGWAGVDVFFVLSGFLITGILYDTRHDPHRVRNFYVRRTLRIFPLYYGLMLVLLLSMPLFHWEITWKWLVWPAYLGNWMNLCHLYPDSATAHLAYFQLFANSPAHKSILFLGHFWTLCVEEQFYLLWPAVVFGVRQKRTLLWICALSVPVELALRVTGHHLLPAWMLRQEVLENLTLFRFDALLLGGLLALLLRGSYREQLLEWSRWLLLPALVPALLWAAAISPLPRDWSRYPYPEQTFTVGLTLIDLLGALLILNAIQPQHWLASLLGVRPLRWLGRLSYGAYVFHDIPHIFYHRVGEALFGANLIGIAIIAFVATLLLAWASFRFYEAPFLNLKERYTVRT